MLAKRIIPCLDVKNGRTVKGVQFKNLVDLGDPTELAAHYAKVGADELVFLDISATDERRSTMFSWVKKVASMLNIPFTVGGGISSIDDVLALLNAGADKISINTAAVLNPTLIDEIAKRCGSQCVVVAIDTFYDETKKNSFIYTNGGKKETEIATLSWVKEITARGAGEILLTSINHDGTKNGFAVELTAEVSSIAGIPVIASGGAGNEQHFKDVFTKGKADAALAAGIFHRNELSIPDLKKYLIEEGITIRP